MADTFSLLLVADARADAEMVSRLLDDELAETATVDWVVTLAAARQRLTGGRGRFDVVLLDPDVSDSEGIATVESVVAAAPGLPVVVLTAAHRRDLWAQALAVGAQDHITKDELARGGILGRAVRYAVARKAAARSLSREQARLRHLLSVVPTIVVALAPDGRVRLLNDYGSRVLGYREAELRGRDWFAAVLPVDEQEPVRTYFRGLIRGGSGMPESFRNRVVTRDGSERVIAWSNAVVRDETGAIAYLLSSGEDVTERERAEAEVRQLSRVVAEAPVLVALIDRDGRIRYVNDAFVRITGYSVEEMVGRTWAEIRCPDQASRPDGPGRALAGEVETVWHRDGGRLVLRTRRAPMHDDAGSMTADAIIGEDITESLEAERRLAQTEKLEALGGFAGGIAHDFNNLLVPIITMASMVRDHQAADSRDYDRLDRVVTAARRAADLVASILEFSRAEVGHKVYARVDRVVEDSLRLLMETLPTTITLNTTITPTPAPTWIDPARLQTVLFNLVGNARDAMAGATGRVRIEVAPEALSPERIKALDLTPADGYVRIVVRDTGPGLPQGALDRAFDPFFTTKEVGKGTGLGLASANGLVTDAGGALRLANAPEGGAIATLYLPLYPDAAETG